MFPNNTPPDTTLLTPEIAFSTIDTNEPEVPSTPPLGDWRLAAALLLFLLVA